MRFGSLLLSFFLAAQAPQGSEISQTDKQTYSLLTLKHNSASFTILTTLITLIPLRTLSHRKAVKDESLGLVSVSRLKVLRLSVSSRSRTKFWN